MSIFFKKTNGSLESNCSSVSLSLVPWQGARVKNILISAFFILAFNSTPAFAAMVTSLNDNKANALALQLSYKYQISPSQPVAIFIGYTEVNSVEVLAPATSREHVSYDFLSYPSNDEALLITGPASAYLGCKAVVDFTQLPTPSKLPDFDALIVSEACEQSLIRN